MLETINNFIDGKDIDEFTVQNPSSIENLNHQVVSNKDGRYDWRSLKLIHPAMYVHLINIITEANNWKVIIDRLDEFSNNKLVECKSLPVVSEADSSDPTLEISNWVAKVEQSSVQLALEYNTIFSTDIVNCYTSIYTHSIPWALHGKKYAKNNRGQNLLGNQLDKIIRNLTFGQTNGIPEGNVAMDLLAEIVLGYADFLLAKEIKNEHKISSDECKIIRYRDDYRIFSNSSEVTNQIVKSLSEILIELGLKLSTQKNLYSRDIVSNSVKPDKLYWLQHKIESEKLLEQLQIIHSLAKEYPNSGVLIKAPKELNDRTKSLNIKKNTELSIVSYLVDIAHKHPRTHAISMALVSKVLEFIENEDFKRDIVKKILSKLHKLPNIGLTEVWLQRAIIKTLEKEYDFTEKLCNIAYNPSNKFWNNSCFNDELSEVIDSLMFIDEVEIAELSDVIESKEIRTSYYDL